MTDDLNYKQRELLELLAETDDWSTARAVSYPKSRHTRESSQRELNTLVDKGYVKCIQPGNANKYRPTVKGIAAVTDKQDDDTTLIEV